MERHREATGARGEKGEGRGGGEAWSSGRWPGERREKGAEGERHGEATGGRGVKGKGRGGGEAVGVAPCSRERGGG